MKTAFFAASALTLSMVASAPVMAVDGWECLVPQGALNALAKNGDTDKAAKIICSANTNAGAGNGSEWVNFTFLKYGDVTDLVSCVALSGLPADDQNINIDGKDPFCFSYGRKKIVTNCTCTDPGNSAP